MDFADIERILELVRQHDLAEFEMEKEGLKLRVRKAVAAPPAPDHPLARVAVRAGHLVSRRRRASADPGVDAWPCRPR